MYASPRADTILRPFKVIPGLFSLLNRTAQPAPDPVLYRRRSSLRREWITEPEGRAGAHPENSSRNGRVRYGVVEGLEVSQGVISHFILG